MARIPLLIPAYEPDDRMDKLIKALREVYHGEIIVVNDGSGDDYDRFYEYAEAQGCILLKHYRNMGKGRALKDAFNYCLNTYPDLVGCVTADADGQHRPEDICGCMRALEKNPDNLILGCRDFDDPNVPFKSKFGNKLTRKVCRFLCGLDISDTQTGLRGIPKAFMEDLLDISGERFEFETRMLIENEGKAPIKEISIETVYDSKEDHQTHFDPIMDSIRIYRILGGMLARFLLSSLSSSMIDLWLFSVFCGWLKGRMAEYLFISTVLARVISATYNCLLNYKFVFQSNETWGKVLSKYVFLAAVQMMSSACLVTMGCEFFYFMPELLVKIIVDVCLFFISYRIQKLLVFKRKMK